MIRKTILTLVAFAVFYMAKAQVYNNPVTDRSLPDPTVIRGDDGAFYLFATEDTHNIPIMKSTDLVNWKYLRTAFTDNNRPVYNNEHGWAFWAPDVNKIGDQYVLYYSLGVWGHGDECAIGVATSKRVWGPYSNAKVMFTSTEIGVNNSIDQFYFKDDDGKQYLFWGSFNGIYAIQLSDDGLSVVEGASPKKIAGTAIEGTYIIKHDDYYYLVGSAGSCCEGANSTYHLQVARSKRLLSGYCNKNGSSALTNNFTEILHGSSEVYGPGHCAEWQVDDNGQYWILYHGYQASNVDAGRVTYLDKVMWDDKGWPYIENSIPSTECEVPYFDTTGINGVTSESLHYSVSVAEGLYMLLIESPDNTPFTWSIYNANGVEMKSGKADESINVWTSDMLSGVYVVKVNGKYGQFTQKIVL